MKKLVLMDFDGTITRKDTLIEFIRFTNGSAMTWLGLILLSPVLFAFKLQLLPNWRAKQMLMRYFWMGRNLEWMQSQGEKFSLQKMDKYIRQSAMNKIKYYQDENWEIVVVTASSSIWVEPWTRRYGLNLISTQLEVDKGLLTGKIKGKNCYGEEKVKRIRKLYDLASFSEIHAYGDSKGDRPMLAIATEQYYKAFKH